MKYKSTFKKLMIIWSTCMITAQYDYSLEDMNSSSSSYGQNIGTAYFQNHVTLHYFGHFT